MGDNVNRRLKDQPDQLFENLNNYHANVNYTVKVCPENFLDTEITYKRTPSQTKNTVIKKLPVHWSSQIPKRYERKAITSDLDRAVGMDSVPGNKIPEIKHKFLNGDYPLRFINSVIKQFRQKSSEKDDFVIKQFRQKSSEKDDFVVLVEIPYYPKSEAFSKHFFKKFDELTDRLYDIRVKWVTKKVKQLFKIKIKNPNPKARGTYLGRHVCLY